jgi:RHS repeat-associated protein
MMQLSGRHSEILNAYQLSSGYRYSFNGKENDKEVSGSGNSIDFGARIYDSRVGRWLSGDPHEIKYPYSSTYAFALNTPIIAVDSEGKDVIVGLQDATRPTYSGHMVIFVHTYKEVYINVRDENGNVISKKYYVIDGGAQIDNMPGVPATRVQHITDMSQFNSITGSYPATVVADSDGDFAISGQIFDASINQQNSDFNAGWIYYEPEIVQAELTILQEAEKRESGNEPYNHGLNQDTGNLFQNDCSSIIVELLLLSGIVDDGNMGKTTVSYGGKDYSFYTPNEIILDLADMGFELHVNNKDGFDKTVTREKSKDYLYNEVKKHVDSGMYGYTGEEVERLREKVDSLNNTGN